VEVGVDLCLSRLIVVIVHELRLEGAPGHLVSLLLFLLIPNLHLGLLAFAAQTVGQGQRLLCWHRFSVVYIRACPLEGVRIR
jgi:hypothetical protein